MPRTQVLIVGAGPTGLVLALWLTHLGVSVRIVDEAAEAGTTSRALAVQARTLELYRQLGLDQAVMEGGHRVATANMWVRGRRAAQLALGPIGQGLSPYPFLIMYPQDVHERMLEARLAEAGVTVRRGTEVTGFTQDTAGVSATLSNGETCQADYIVGCDGARSMVRKQVAGEFPGGTYAQLFYVADVVARGSALDGELHVDLDTADFVVLFPLKGKGRARLIGTVMADRVGDPDALTFEDVSRSALRGMQIEVETVNWFSTYHVHHRVADRFRRGRALIVGDAAHIHSPVGGQGMNTGLGDAINLAWKLAAVVQGRAGDDLLNTYEAERIAFARRLVATTDRAFTLVTSDGPVAKIVRTRLVPLVLPLLVGLRAVRTFMFRTVSQIAITYRGGALSAGAVGEIHGGDRMPWVETAAGDNFEGLDPRHWHLVTYGETRPDLRAWCEATGVKLHAHSWTAAAAKGGLKQGATYLLRPDGYIALVDPSGSTAALDRYFATHHLKPS
jgi:2-polyprenyl-6-methoxyphenol hydroxylase-like FAD-dependent oxidoreductase